MGLPGRGRADGEPPLVETVGLAGELAVQALLADSMARLRRLQTETGTRIRVDPALCAATITGRAANVAAARALLAVNATAAALADLRLADEDPGGR